MKNAVATGKYIHVYGNHIRYILFVFILYLASRKLSYVLIAFVIINQRGHILPKVVYGHEQTVPIWWSFFIFSSFVLHVGIPSVTIEFPLTTSETDLWWCHSYYHEQAVEYTGCWWFEIPCTSHDVTLMIEPQSSQISPSIFLWTDF